MSSILFPKDQPEIPTPTYHPDQDGFVYLVWADGTEAVKVGFSKLNPLGRVRDLQVGNHCELILLGAISGDHKFEAYLHDWGKGAGAHIRGEWFSRDWVLTVIDRYRLTNEFIPPDELHDIDPELGYYCESGAFVAPD